MTDRQSNMVGPIYRDIARVAVTRRRISRRVRELANEIARDFGDGEMTILAVLTGSLIFLADLIRQLPLRMRLDLISVSSYPGKATRSKGVKLPTAAPVSLKGHRVLIVDDILDSGQTLAALLQAVNAVKPASVRTCVLLRKQRSDLSNRVEADFVGFEVADEFLVGYGLDYDNAYRNLPDICVLKEHARTAPSQARKAPRRRQKGGAS